MIFSALKDIGIPYIVIKFKIRSGIDSKVGRYAYQIFTDKNSKLPRLGFKLERRILRLDYDHTYMYRDLTEREVRIFKTYHLKPDYISEDGIVWEVQGKMQRYPDVKKRRDSKGKFKRPKPR